MSPPWHSYRPDVVDAARFKAMTAGYHPTEEDLADAAVKLWRHDTRGGAQDRALVVQVALRGIVDGYRSRMGRWAPTRALRLDAENHAVSFDWLAEAAETWHTMPAGMSFPTAADEYGHVDVVDVVERVLASLKPRHREWVRAIIAGESLTAIARTAGVAVPSVMAQRDKFRARLLEQLAA